MAGGVGLGCGLGLGCGVGAAYGVGLGCGVGAGQGVGGGNAGGAGPGPRMQYSNSWQTSSGEKSEVTMLVMALLWCDSSMHREVWSPTLR